MVKLNLTQNQPAYFLLLSSLPTNTQIIAPFFSPIFPSQPEFEINCAEVEQDQIPSSRKLNCSNEGNDVSLEEVSSKNERKTIKHQESIYQFSNNKAKKRIGHSPTKKMYEKDKERNILPNAVSKMFFFLKSKSKSEDLLKKILEQHQNLSSEVTPSKYYIYQNVLKSNRGRFMTIESLQSLFTFIDEKFSIFSRSEQVAFIKINSIMLRMYIRSGLFLPHLLTSRRIGKDKIVMNLEKYHEIDSKIKDLIKKAETYINCESDTEK